MSEFVCVVGTVSAPEVTVLDANHGTGGVGEALEAFRSCYAEGCTTGHRPEVSHRWISAVQTAAVAKETGRRHDQVGVGCVAGRICRRHLPVCTVIYTVGG